MSDYQSMTMQESHNHHFVPKLLLRPWLVEDPQGHLNLWGYWWDPERRLLMQKRRGLNSFCCQLDLLSLQAHNLGRDVIERLFFGEIDTRGAVARNLLVDGQMDDLSVDQRCDFARLLLSLDIRRPRIVSEIRTKRDYLANELDTDRKILAAMSEEGINETPSSYVENHLGWRLQDRALLVIQKLVDNPAVGRRLINAHWHIRRLGITDGTFVLADRPLIRIHGYDRPGATWVLPLTPKVVFIACNAIENLQRLTRLSDQRFAKEVNRSSVNQAERFVFCVDRSHEIWLGKRLSQVSYAAGP
jgi:hypothetical protein